MTMSVPNVVTRACKPIVPRTLVVVAAILLAPTAGYAQSAIAGKVTDTSGAILPGVTVEAASPALIERVRSVATDDGGLYKIVDLRPGTYVVTFSLAGFSSLKREGIELTGAFTATVNAEMTVGALEETVTVSGASPIVDVQNVIQQRVVTREILDATPTGRSYFNFAQLLPGAQMIGTSRPSGQDVGGLSGDRNGVSIHGSRPNDLVQELDGLPINILNRAGGSNNIIINPAEVAEFNLQYGAISAEIDRGGLRVNVIPKEGGNDFEGSFFFNFSKPGLQSDNLTPELSARGLPAASKINELWDVSSALGGPIAKSRLWFFASYRYWGLNEGTPVYYDANPRDFVYTADRTRQGFDDNWTSAESLRLTWQATPTNKFNLFVVNDHRCWCHRNISATRAPEASVYQKHPAMWNIIGSWRSPVTSRVLLEAGTSIRRFKSTTAPEDPITPDLISITEQSTGFVYRAAPSYGINDNHVQDYRASLSYVTGAHALKFGAMIETGQLDTGTQVNGDMTLTLLNGIPRSVTAQATPFTSIQKLNADIGVFAQDQWTLNRLTLNVGVRWNYLHASVPAQHEPAARFVPERNFEAIDNVPKWTDLLPRVGVAYNLFGNGKTAVKASLSRYVIADKVDFTTLNNPFNTSVNTVTRTWTDLNNDFVPNCDFSNPAIQPECGVGNVNFGKVLIRTRYEDAVREGFGSRGYNWEGSAGIQHELLERVSIKGEYFRRWFGNFTATDNLEWSPADFSQFCVTAPVDAALPSGGGNQICGLYDVSPTKVSLTNNLVTFASTFGKQTEVYDGVDLTVTARLARGANLQGGVNFGRLTTNNCFVVDSPQLRFCDVKPPFQPQIKLLGTLPLPWDIQTAATFQSNPGPAILQNYVASGSQIQGLGRPLSTGANGTVSVPLIEPGTQFAERLYQVDVRVTKSIRVRGRRIQGMVDIDNLFNASPVLTLNSQYSPGGPKPTYILPGRLIKFGTQLTF